ncbi:MAG: ATP-binding cassette domain-containing protein, partial [Methanothrix sp.]
MALLEIKGVSKQFFADGKEMVALQDINLEIKDNEFICFIGPSGCGKTTLL